LERLARTSGQPRPATASRVSRPPDYAWALLWLLALIAVQKLHPAKLDGRWLVLTPLLLAGGVLVLRRLWQLPPAWTLCAAIALTVFVNGWWRVGLGGMPLNRLLIVIVLFQFALGARALAGLPRPRFGNVHLLMCATVVYALASAAAAGTLTDKESFLLMVDVLGVLPFLLFFLAPSIFPGERERNLLLATLVGLGLYLGVTSIFESIGPRALVFPSYILRTDQHGAPGLIQAGGPFQSPVAEGFAVFACAVASGIAFLRWRGVWQRVLAATCCVTCLFACFATLERGVWLAAVLAAIVTAAATRTGRRWFVPAVIVSAIGIGAVLTLSSQLSQHTAQRAGYEKSVWDRQNQMAAGLRMVETKPIFGFGWNRYSRDSEDFFRQPSNYPMVGYLSTPGAATTGSLVSPPPAGPRSVIPLHNTYLAYAVDLGLVGLLLWLLALLGAVFSGIGTPGPASLRPWKLGLLAIFVFFLVISFFDPHEQSFPITLLLVWAGVASGPAPLGRRGPGTARQAPKSHDPFTSRLLDRAPVALAGSRKAN
jgi:putative inorganic carbon (hco3(-)) transporter